MSGLAGQMSYSVRLSRSEALIEQHITDMLRVMGTLNGDNIITFLYVYGKFCKTKNISYGAAEERMWTIMMPGVRAQVEKTFTAGGPVMTDSAVVAPLQYMGGDWIADPRNTQTLVERPKNLPEELPKNPQVETPKLTAELAGRRNGVKPYATELISQ